MPGQDHLAVTLQLEDVLYLLMRIALGIFVASWRQRSVGHVWLGSSSSELRSANERPKRL